MYSLQLNDQTPEMSALFQAMMYVCRKDKLKLFDKASKMHCFRMNK